MRVDRAGRGEGVEGVNPASLTSLNCLCPILGPRLVDVGAPLFAVRIAYRPACQRVSSLKNHLDSDNLEIEGHFGCDISECQHVDSNCISLKIVAY